VEPSRALLAEHVARSGQAIETRSVLCGAAFDALLAGRRDEHDRLVVEAASALAPEVDRIVLAQASLAHLAGTLEEQLKMPVLASPELMVREVVARVRAAT
jgi:hypothetical protein